MIEKIVPPHVLVVEAFHDAPEARLPRERAIIAAGLLGTAERGSPGAGELV